MFELGNSPTIGIISRAVKTLSELKGVGPAMATFVLQACSDEIPIMSDEAMMEIFNCDEKRLKYDFKTCITFIEKVVEIRDRLGKGKGLSETG